MADRIVEYAQVCMRGRKTLTPFSRKSYLISLVFFPYILVMFLGDALRAGLYYPGGVRFQFTFSLGLP
jgi:protein phosphatase PTC7